MFPQITTGVTVRVIDGHFMTGVIRRIVKIHQSGVLAYLEAKETETASMLYFNIRYLEPFNGG